MNELGQPDQPTHAEEAPSMITSAPGFESVQASTVAVHGDVVSTAPEDFKGDPRRIAGHPSNPATNINFASLPKPEPLAQPPADEANMITHVPTQDELNHGAQN